VERDMAENSTGAGLGDSALLREVEESDLPIFFEQQIDPEGVYMAAFTPKDPTARDGFMAHWYRILEDDTSPVRTIVDDGNVAGYVASYIDEEFGKREVTYWIGREYWGRGLATWALAEYLKEVKERPIYGRAARDNAGSIRVMEKCGFVVTGYGKGYANARDAVIEEVILELK